MKNMTPPSLSLHHFRLSVGDDHALAVSVHGNQNAPNKAIVLHGGPGAGCSGAELEMFDLDNWQVVLFDQRGCGESTPYLSLADNTIDNLVSDIEKVRLSCFGDQKVTLVGGSWGTCLAMLAAIEQPQTVNNIVLRGVFFGDDVGGRHIAEPSADIVARAPEWFAFYQDFVHPMDVTDHSLIMPRSDLIAAYNDVLSRDCWESHVEAARHFMAWDTAIAFPSVHEEAVYSVLRNPEEHVAITKIFMHFAANEFKAENRDRILGAQDKLAGIPISIIHGEMDWICPVENAHALAAAYPQQTSLHVIPCGGHSMSDEQIMQQLQSALALK